MTQDAIHTQFATDTLMGFAVILLDPPEDEGGPKPQLCTDPTFTPERPGGAPYMWESYEAADRVRDALLDMFPGQKYIIATVEVA